jgi:O-succinylbenzoate synthase
VPFLNGPLTNAKMFPATQTSEAHLIGIKSIALHRVRVPLLEPFRISNGSINEKDAILIELRTDRNIVGWGEASAMSGAFYSDDTPERSWASLSDSLIPSVLNVGEVDVASS